MTDQQLISHLKLRLKESTLAQSELMAENHELSDYVEQLEYRIILEGLDYEINWGIMH